MTEAQFAELLTSMNVGFGVPCTIAAINCQQVEPPPEGVLSEAELVHEDIKQKAAELSDRLAKAQGVYSRWWARPRWPRGTRMPSRRSWTDS